MRAPIPAIQPPSIQCWPVLFSKSCVWPKRLALNVLGMAGHQAAPRGMDHTSRVGNENNQRINVYHMCTVSCRDACVLTCARYQIEILRPCLRSTCGASTDSHGLLIVGIMSPKRKVPLETLDVSGLGEEWDGEEDIRDRLRGGKYFTFTDSPSCGVGSCVENSSILIPILTRMSVLSTRPLPYMDDLRAEIEKTFNKNKRETTAEASEEIVKASWSVKKMRGFVKMKARRGEVSAVTCLLKYRHGACNVSI